MGYYTRWGRSPEQVQIEQGRPFDFEIAKEVYESITPLRGLRSKLDVRPIRSRDRCHERIVKVSDDEYYITCNAYRWAEIRKMRDDEHYKDFKPCRAITFRKEKDAGIETITIHVPRAYWGDYPIDISAFNSSSVFHFYKHNLPMGLDFINNKSDKYVVVDTDDGKKYYPLERTDVVVYRKNGETQWKLMSAMRKVVHKVDREKSKKVREIAKPFMDYIATMMPLVEPKHIWGNVIKEQMKLKAPAISWEEVVTPKGDEIPEIWFTMAQNYKSRASNKRWVRNEETGEWGYVYSMANPKEMVKRDLYNLARPYKKVEVPLGEMAHDYNPE